ncbi:ABC transporter ATP-binding protein [Chengkuizengella marina]|uniref:ATP-binding cassette domain-containing protein n=1 Tax=Chengkuizengella marina TaxID=2507566 RepID=A0A6N9Q2I5_9BACL|nr:ATP-binding cassette domain-containing protein [Chengkuizengella marina]NBI29010.1 ATP-binding cassette domain-containing protein [Chengkuizengella marina]
MLKINHVTKLFNANTVDEKLALSNVNLSLAPSDFVTVIGSNGAGKSTLMNVISGVLKPDDGNVIIDDVEVNKLHEYQRSQWIARVFQDPMAGTSPNMTIAENLSIAYLRGYKRTLNWGLNKKKKHFFKEQLERLGIGLENRLNAKVGLLSGGERQALSLLMATFTKPKILLLDEHTAALDPSRAELISNLTEKVVREFNLTTLMVTHNMAQAIQLGNRLIMMDKGQVIMDIPPSKKQGLTVEDLLHEFTAIKGEELNDDRVILG